MHKQMVMADLTGKVSYQKFCNMYVVSSQIIAPRWLAQSTEVGNTSLVWLSMQMFQGDVY